MMTMQRSRCLSSAVSLLLLVILAAAASSCSAKTKPTVTMNPLCPKKLTSEKGRYNCYHLVIKELLTAMLATSPAQPAATADIMAHWLEPDVVGRTTAGNFKGVELNSEYFAAAVPTFAISGKLMAKIPYITNFATTGHVASFTADHLVTVPTLNISANWTLSGWFKFSPDSNRIAAYDIHFLRFMEFLETVGTIAPSNPALEQRFIAGTSAYICNKTVTLCTGDSTQYANMTACMGILSKVPIIRANGDLQSNCLLCRAVHSILLSYDPKLHCPHVGPTGGGACSDKLYGRYASQFPEGTFFGKSSK